MIKHDPTSAFPEPKQECTVCSTSGAYYLSAKSLVSVLLLSIHRLSLVQLYVCRAKKARKGGRKMTSYFIEPTNISHKIENAEMAEFANQFGNTLCPDEISFDA